MTDPRLFEQLHTDGLLSDESYRRIVDEQQKPQLLSVHWEVKTLLYLGILLLTTRLGIAVYKNIDTIGHQVILAFIALVTIVCFGYCFKHKPAFSRYRTQSPVAFFDYVLLLGTLSLLIFIGYIQFQYNVFGIHYGLATFIPTVLLFYIACNFDHLGILNMAIVNLGLWMGIAATPKGLLSAHTFNSQHLINIYAVFGLVLLTATRLTGYYKFKPHFKFSYNHYGVYATLTACLAGYFINYDSQTCWLWMLGLFALAAYIAYDAFTSKQFYFILIACLYAYIGVSSLVVRVLMIIHYGIGLWLIFYYFILSAIGGIYWLVQFQKKLKYDRL